MVTSSELERAAQAATRALRAGRRDRLLAALEVSETDLVLVAEERALRAYAQVTGQRGGIAQVEVEEPVLTAMAAAWLNGAIAALHLPGRASRPPLGRQELVGAIAELDRLSVHANVTQVLRGVDADPEAVQDLAVAIGRRLSGRSEEPALTPEILSALWMEGLVALLIARP